MVIPRLIRQALAGEPLTVYGDGTQRRCFCHVADVVDALADLMRRADVYGDVFNLGATEEISISELAERIRRLSGSGSEISIVPYSEAYEERFEAMPRRVPDTGKVHELLGWEPTRNLDLILADVIEHERRSTAASASNLPAGPATGRVGA